MLYGVYKYGQAAYSTANLEDGASVIAATSAVSATAGFVKEASCAISAAASTSISGQAVREDSSAIAVTSAAQADPQVILQTWSAIAAASSTTGAGIAIRGGELRLARLRT